MSCRQVAHAASPSSARPHHMTSQESHESHESTPGLYSPRVAPRSSQHSADYTGATPAPLSPRNGPITEVAPPGGQGASHGHIGNAIGSAGVAAPPPLPPPLPPPTPPPPPMPAPMQDTSTAILQRLASLETELRTLRKAQQAPVYPPSPHGLDMSGATYAVQPSHRGSFFRRASQLYLSARGPNSRPSRPSRPMLRTPENHAVPSADGGKAQDRAPCARQGGGGGDLDRSGSPPPHSPSAHSPSRSPTTGSSSHATADTEPCPPPVTPFPPPVPPPVPEPPPVPPPPSTPTGVEGC